MSGNDKTIQGFEGKPNWSLMLCEREAALYVGLPRARFNRAVECGQLPPARQLCGLNRWSRYDIDAHLHADTPTSAVDFDPVAAAIEAAGVIA